MDIGVLATVLILATGALAFLRLVAREKCRREKYLQFRLEEQLTRIEEERQQAEKAASERRERETVAQTRESLVSLPR